MYNDMKKLFFIGVLLVSKRSSWWCNDQLDCPRHMYCHLYMKGLPGICRHFPLIPLPIPVSIPIPQERITQGKL